MAKKKEEIEVTPLNLADEKERLKVLADGVSPALIAAQAKLDALAVELIRMEGFALSLANNSTNAEKIQNFGFAFSQTLLALGELGFDKVADAIEKSKS